MILARILLNEGKETWAVLLLLDPFFSAKKESPISFLAIGNMTMCKILKDLSKELLPKGEKSTVFMIKTTFGN